MFCCCQEVKEGSGDTQFVSIHALEATKEDAAPASGGYSPVSFSATSPAADSPALAADRKGDDDSAPFSITLERGAEGSPYGLHLDLSDGFALYICRLGPGDTVVHRYNTTASAQRQLRAGDFILEINGKVSDAKALAEEVRLKPKLEMKVCHPTLRQVTVDKADKSMGLDLRYSAASNTLCIAKVLDGVVLASGVDVKAGDRILSVDGKQGTSAELLNWVKDSAAPVLLISSCPEVRKAMVVKPAAAA